jgi:tryptophan synthase beta chain
MTTSSVPGRFGPYGGRYVPETLIPALDELAAAWESARSDPAFRARIAEDLRDWAGRPTPLTLATRSTLEWGGAEVWLKREDLLHTGAHKVNNTVGQVQLALRMGKQRIIAETGAGQHGVATAAACARVGLPCEVFMGAEDIRRQAPNVERMKLLGAVVRPVESGSRTLKDAMNEAIRDWVTNVRTTFYVIGSVAGPHPYPSMVRDLQAVIGEEARRQCLERWGALPEAVVACVGGGSNAMGIFSAFLGDPAVRLVAVEAGGEGLASGKHGASLTAGRFGVLHGSASSVLQTDAGQVRRPTPSAPGSTTRASVRSWPKLRDAGRLDVRTATDDEALDAPVHPASWRHPPALETAHALARARDVARSSDAGDGCWSTSPAVGTRDLRTCSAAGPPQPGPGPVSASRLQRHFEEARRTGVAPLIVYLCGGDPDLASPTARPALAARGRTSSRSASPSPTHSPTVRPSRPPRSGRAAGTTLRESWRWWPGSAAASARFPAADGLPQPHRPDGHRGLRRPGCRGGRRWLHRARPPSRSRQSSAAGRHAGCRWSCSPRQRRRPIGSGASASRRRASSTT